MPLIQTLFILYLRMFVFDQTFIRHRDSDTQNQSPHQKWSSQASSFSLWTFFHKTDQFQSCSFEDQWGRDRRKELGPEKCKRLSIYVNIKIKCGDGKQGILEICLAQEFIFSLCKDNHQTKDFIGFRVLERGLELFWLLNFPHLENDPCRADQHSHGEDPEEEPVQDHGHILPVLENLQRDNN